MLKMRVLKIMGLRSKKELNKKPDDELTITIQDIHKESSFATEYSGEDKKDFNREGIICHMLQKIGQGENDHESNSSSGSKDSNGKLNARSITVSSPKENKNSEIIQAPKRYDSDQSPAEKIEEESDVEIASKKGTMTLIEEKKEEEKEIPKVEEKKMPIPDPDEGCEVVDEGDYKMIYSSNYDPSSYLKKDRVIPQKEEEEDNDDSDSSSSSEIDPNDFSEIANVNVKLKNKKVKEIEEKVEEKKEEIKKEIISKKELETEKVKEVDMRKLGKKVSSMKIAQKRQSESRLMESRISDRKIYEKKGTDIQTALKRDSEKQLTEKKITKENVFELAPHPEEEKKIFKKESKEGTQLSENDIRQLRILDLEKSKSADLNLVEAPMKRLNLYSPRGSMLDKKKTTDSREREQSLLSYANGRRERKIRICDDLADFEEYPPTNDELALKKTLLSHQTKNKKKKEKGKEAVEEKEEDDEKQGLLKKEDEIDDESNKDPQKDLDDGEGSLGSSSSDTARRTNYSIRAAVDEKFVPKSIKNMNIMTILMLLLVLGLAITYYYLEITLYSSISSTINNIGISEQRQSWLIDINLRLGTLILITSDNNATNESTSPLNMSMDAKNQLYASSSALLKSSAISLKNAQDVLSETTSNLSPANIDQLNPYSVILNYKMKTNAIASHFNYTISESILEVVVSAFKIVDSDPSTITDSDFSTYLITNNSLNSIIIALDAASNLMLTLLDSSKQNNLTIFLILLIVASGAALFSTAVLIPIIIIAKRNKDQVFKLFLYLKKEEIRQYQIKCDRFKKSNKIVFFLDVKLIIERR